MLSASEELDGDGGGENDGEPSATQQAQIDQVLKQASQST